MGKKRRSVTETVRVFRADWTDWTGRLFVNCLSSTFLCHFWLFRYLAFLAVEGEV